MVDDELHVSEDNEHYRQSFTFFRGRAGDEWTKGYDIIIQYTGSTRPARNSLRPPAS